MKTRGAYLATLAVLIALGDPAGATDRPAATPPLAAVAGTYDAGRVEVGVPVTHTYTLRNDGSTPIQISVKPSCGCTTTEYDKVIPPGGIGNVTAVLDTTHIRGRVSKTLHITTNAPMQPALTLTLTAETIRILDVLPSETPIVRAPVGTLKAIELTVTAPDGEPFAIVRIEDAPDLHARFEPADPPSNDGEHRRYHVTLTPKADLAVGTYTPAITLVTTLAAAERFQLHPTIVVSGPLTTMPQQLRVRSATLPVSVRIIKAGTSPFNVVRSESSDRDFTATATAVEGGQSWDVTLRYVGNTDRHGPVDAILTITTDEPTQPRVQVRIAGQL